MGPFLPPLPPVWGLALICRGTEPGVVHLGGLCRFWGRACCHSGQVLGGGKQGGHPRHPGHAEDAQVSGDPATAHHKQHISEWQIPPADGEMPKSAPGFETLSNKMRNHMADQVLVLRSSVRPEPLRWESRVQDIGPPETSEPHVISISESSPRDLQLNAKTQLT